MKNKLLDLLGESVLISGCIALLLIGTACYMWIMQYAVPVELMALLTTVVGFFFGAKSQKAINTRMSP